VVLYILIYMYDHLNSQEHFVWREGGETEFMTEVLRDCDMYGLNLDNIRAIYILYAIFHQNI